MLNDPITWGDMLNVFVLGVLALVVMLAVYGLGYSRGWWDQGDGPGVE